MVENLAISLNTSTVEIDDAHQMVEGDFVGPLWAELYAPKNDVG